MGRTSLLLSVCVFAIAAVVGACRGNGQDGGPLRVVVTMPPLAGLVRPLAPEGTEITILLPPGRSEHGYELTIADRAAIEKAHVLVYVSPALETKVHRFAENHRKPERVDLSFAEAVGVGATGEEHADHEQEEEEEHAHGGEDPHLWLDPVLVERFIPRIHEAVLSAQRNLGRADVKEIQRMKDAAGALQKRVHDFHEAAKAKLQPVAGQSIVTHHSAWGRLAERYGLRVAAVVRPVETSEPTPASIAGAVDQIKREGARAIFIEPQFSNSPAVDKIVAATGVRKGRLDPLGDGDWFAMMQSNVDVLAELLSERGPEPKPPATAPREPGR
jgi:zinc transport system substrate-binding protein